MTLSDDETDDGTLFGDDESDDDDDGVTFYGSDDEVASQFGDDDDGDVTFYGDDDHVESEFGDDDDDGGVTFYGNDDDDDDGVTFYGSDVGGDNGETASDAGGARALSDCVKVGLAEYAVADDHQCLSTSGLGSCIGVALHDRDAGVYGLIHFMLPYADDVNGEDFDDAKFADTGIEALLAAMRHKGADPDDVEAKVAGGSTMVDFSDPEDGVGKRNIDAVQSVLDDLGIEITGSDLGGDRGRTVRYDPVAVELEVQIAHGETITL